MPNVTHIPKITILDERVRFEFRAFGTSAVMLLPMLEVDHTGVTGCITIEWLRHDTSYKVGIHAIFAYLPRRSILCIAHPQKRFSKQIIGDVTMMGWFNIFLRFIRIFGVNSGLHRSEIEVAEASDTQSLLFLTALLNLPAHLKKQSLGSVISEHQLPGTFANAELYHYSMFDRHFYW